MTGWGMDVVLDLFELRAVLEASSSVATQATEAPERVLRSKPQLLLERFPSGSPLWIGLASIKGIVEKSYDHREKSGKETNQQHSSCPRRFGLPIWGQRFIHYLHN